MDLSIVIPVYNSQEILPTLLFIIQKEISFVKKFELILVNDNSPDDSWKTIVNLKRQYKFLKGINLIKNFSQHNAIMAGLNESSGKIIIMMDDDLQHSPSDVKKIYDEMLSKKSDVCYTKFTKKKHSFIKNFGSRFNDFVANILLSKPKNLYLSPFKGITNQIKDIIIEYNGPYPYIDGLILSATNNISSIVIDHHERTLGAGNYTLIKSISLWIKMATGFSVFPLRLATYSGLIISFFSFCLGLVYIIQKLFFNPLPLGFTSVIVMVLFLGGVQLLSIGIIGEYIGRLYLKSNNRAQYSIREKI